MKLFEWIKSLCIKYRQLILYAFFGVFTTLANLALYFLCTKVFHWNVLLSNAVAWLGGVIVAFVTNKLFVFESRDTSFRTVLREGLEFAAGRALTGVFEEIFLYITVERMGLWDIPMKLICNVVVIILNFVFSKLIIFREGDKKVKAEDVWTAEEENHE